MFLSSIAITNILLRIVQPADNNTLNYSWNSGIEQISLKAEYNYYLNNYNTIDFGASTTYKHFMPGQLEGNTTAIDNITQCPTIQ